MNRGTIIRTVLAVASVINSGAVASGIAEFENPTVNAVYEVLSFVAMTVILFVNTYYNNDYTEAAAHGTGLTRMLKAGNLDSERNGLTDEEMEETNGEDI